MTTEHVPTIEDLQGKNMREVLDHSVIPSRTLTVELSAEEYTRIGGDERSFQELSTAVSDYVNKYVTKIGRIKNR